MSAPYKGLEKIKRGQYKYRIAGIYVTIGKVDDKLWKLTCDFSTNPFLEIKRKLPAVQALELVMQYVRVEADTLHAIYGPLRRVNDLIARKVMATNQPLSRKQLNEAPVGSKITIEHLRWLGQQHIRSSIYAKVGDGNWKVPRGPVYEAMEATVEQLLEWSKFGDAVLELQENSFLEAGTLHPHIEVEGVRKDVREITIKTDHRGRREVTLRIGSRHDGSHLRYVIDRELFADIPLPEDGKYRTVDPAVIRHEAAGWWVETVNEHNTTGYECGYCGATVERTTRYMLNTAKPSHERVKCMKCVVQSGNTNGKKPEPESTDPMDRLASAMERIAKTQEKQAKEMKYMPHMPHLFLGRY